MDKTQKVRVTAVRSKWYGGEYYPWVEIRFTPVEVYDHVVSFGKFLKDLRKRSGYIRLVDEINSKNNSFRKIGLRLNLGIHASEKDMERLEAKLKPMVGKTYVGP